MRPVLRLFPHIHVSVYCTPTGTTGTLGITYTTDTIHTADTTYTIWHAGRNITTGIAGRRFNF